MYEEQSNTWDNLSSFEVNDVCNIPWKTEDEVVNYLGRRFEKGEFYTWAGLTLVAVNPCQEISFLYSEDLKELYNSFGKDENYKELQPHVYAIAARTLHRLINETGKLNQAIVISGDSGSGKTFTARQLLNFLATYGFRNSHYDVSKVSQTLWQIWCSVPILIAFGNAQTECNNNSSRYGKLLRLQYGNSKIVGASVDTYLLEKTRVAVQGRNERNFHIFHQLLAGLSQHELKSLHLSSNTCYKIVPGPIKPEDSHNYVETTAAMIELGITHDLKKQILILLAAIIHLGNITFISKDDMYIVNEYDAESFMSLESASQLLGLQDVCLKRLLTTKQISAQVSGMRRHTIYRKSASSIEDCYSRRDCIMRFLYERLFQWIVSFINTKVKADANNFKELGILDIYGFEIFEHNSLEQLCINYANERLQHFFVQDVLLTQQNILQDEGYEGEISSYAENQERLKLLDAPVSVFGILNEECTLQRHSTDETICQRLVSNLSQNKYLVTKNSFDTTQFTIRHFAGEVSYSINKMLDKNTDKIPGEISDFLSLSSNDFIRQILEEWEFASKDKYNKHTLLSKFKNSLDELIKILKTADVHYIRCMKATPNLNPGVLDRSFFKNKLKASGILEAVFLSQQYFPISLKYTDFNSRYGILLKNKMKSDKPMTEEEPAESDSMKETWKLPRQIIGEILHTEDIDSSVKFGRFTLFITESVLIKLERCRQKMREEASIKIQKSWKKHHEKRISVAVINQQNFCEYCPNKNRSIVYSESETPVKCVDVNKHNNDIKMHHLWDGSGDQIYCGSTAPKIMSSDKIIDLPRFSRTIHYGDGIISLMTLAKVPLHFHIKRTVLPYSHMLPHSELPKGLADAVGEEW